MSGVADEALYARRFVDRRGWAEAEAAFKERWTARAPRLAPGREEQFIASMRRIHERRRSGDG